MNELLQKHGCANVFTIPEGLKELMSDISREVLREQPTKIYDFIANYLSVLLITREHGILAIRILDDLCDCRPSIAEHLSEAGLTGEQSAIIGDIIKQEIENTEPTEGKETVKEAQILKRILAKVVLDEVLTAKVCQISRNAYREYWYRKKLLEQSLKVAADEPWEIAAERTLQIYKSTKPSFTELTRAAEKIQAAYRGYHVRRHLLNHLKPKKKKRGPKVELPGPPLDIAASRELDLGPLINIKVPEDNVKIMFDEHATQKLGLPYNPQTAITHVDDTVLDDNTASTDRSKGASRDVDLKSTNNIVQPSQMPVSEIMGDLNKTTSNYAADSEAPPRRSRLVSYVPEPVLRQSQDQVPDQVESTHLSFAKVLPEVIPDESPETEEPSEVPEDIPDDRTDGDGESAPTASIPTSAPETDVSEVEDIPEDLTSSGDEEG